MDDHAFRNAELLELVEEAKKRYIFYYEHCSEVDENKRNWILRVINETFKNLEFGFDFSKEKTALAYFCEDKINVTDSFWKLSREEQIAVLIHEINHAISHNNIFNYMVEAFYSNAYYENSYKVIEEGLADINSELIMNYYYENSGVLINNKFKNCTNFTCGYPIDRKIMKTMLVFMQIIGKDKLMLLEYYFFSKNNFFDMMISIGGKEAFEMIMQDKSYGRDAINQQIADEYFRSLEKKFIEEMEKKDFSSGGGTRYYYTKFDNVYLVENDLCESLRISYFTSKMLERFDIENVDKKMIDEIYNMTNGTISQITSRSVGYIAQSVDKLICCWIDNCESIDDFKYITKIVPNVFSINNNKYLYLLCKKKANVDLTSIKIENVDEVISVLNETFGDFVDEKMYNKDDVYSSVIIYPDEFFLMIEQVYNLANKEQIDKFKMYHALSIEFKVMLWVKKILGDEKIFTYDKLNEMLNNEMFSVEILNTFLSDEIKYEMIKSYIENCTYDRVYFIESIFPDAFTMNDGEFFEYAYLLCKISDDEFFNSKKK